MNLDWKRFGKVAGLGVPVVVLYTLLFLNQELVLEWSTRGKGYFVVPVAIAFVFSLAHGTFTSAFWDLLGVKAKK